MKVRLQFRVARVLCPVSRRALPEDILQIDSCTSFNEEPNELVMAGESGLMQGCRMGMEADRIVSVWILARIQQRTDNLDVAELRCQRERPVAIVIAGGWK